MFNAEQDIFFRNMSPAYESPYNAMGMPDMASKEADDIPVYPDVYFKIQPFVMMSCDKMDAEECKMPNHEKVQQLTENIRYQVERMHPEFAEIQSLQFGRGNFFNELITIMLLNEFFRRRRRYY